MQKPLEIIDGIPVYSARNRYIENYEKIAEDVFKAERAGERHPYIIDLDLWSDVEDTTVDLIRTYCRTGGKILDVGVGPGTLLGKLPDYDRYGIDISLEMLKVAQKKGIHVTFSLVEQMPDSWEGMFDVVVATDILEHVLNLNLALEKIFHVLKLGGHLIARVPYRESLKKYFTEMNQYHFVHMRNFDDYSIKLLFERIFPYQIMETKTDGYEVSRERLRWFHLPTGDRVLRLFFKIVGKVSRTLEQILLAALFHPLEINVVVKKIQ